MEYADNGDLLQLINSYKKKRVYLKEKEIWSISIQIIKGNIPQTKNSKSIESPPRASDPP